MIPCIFLRPRTIALSRQYAIKAMGFKAQLSGCIPEEVIRRIPSRFEVIGDIAIISLPEEIKGYASLIADAIRSGRHSIHTVVQKTGRVEGDRRTGRYGIIHGETTVTTHREFGFLYRLDIASVFYNPRLASERRRVAGQVQPGESVLVPFCGIGPFVIPAAAKGASITAVENNPDAFCYLQENLRLNHCTDRVHALCGDAFSLSFPMGRQFDRIIIPTPYGMDAILPLLRPRVKPGGMVHFYTFKNKRQSEELEDGFFQAGFRVITRRRCGNVAPSVSRWVFDLKKMEK